MEPATTRVGKCACGMTMQCGAAGRAARTSTHYGGGPWPRLKVNRIRAPTSCVLKLDYYMIYVCIVLVFDVTGGAGVPTEQRHARREPSENLSCTTESVIFRDGARWTGRPEFRVSSSVPRVRSGSAVRATSPGSVPSVQTRDASDEYVTHSMRRYGRHISHMCVEY